VTAQNTSAALGTDFLCEPTVDGGMECDVDFDLSENTNGQSVYLRAIFLRLTTRRGGLWYDPSYGLHVGHYLLSTATDSEIRQEVAAECLKDERTANALVRVDRTLKREGDTMTITVQLQTNYGQTYTMTIGIESTTAVRLITQQAA